MRGEGGEEEEQRVTWRARHRAQRETSRRGVRERSARRAAETCSATSPEAWGGEEMRRREEEIRRR